MRTAGRFFVILALALSWGACRDPVADLTPGSDLIFVGTVLLVNSSTIDATNPQGLTVVRVDEVVQSAEGITVAPGDQITVAVKTPAAFEQGARHVFFTKAWYFGESLGVIERGIIDAPDRTAEVRQQVRRVTDLQAEAALKERIRRTELVVRGVVATVSRMEDHQEASEHAADWHTAEITISEVLKGTHSAPAITIMFPNSDDVMWFRSPKFAVGARGVWLLRTETLSGIRLLYRSALQKEDFFPREREVTILRLLK